MPKLIEGPKAQIICASVLPIYFNFIAAPADYSHQLSSLALLDLVK
jgi:hypothetical protein